jgi:hypothetical protein
MFSLILRSESARHRLAILLHILRALHKSYLSKAKFALWSKGWVPSSGRVQWEVTRFARAFAGGNND